MGMICYSYIEFTSLPTSLNLQDFLTMVLVCHLSLPQAWPHFIPCFVNQQRLKRTKSAKCQNESVQFKSPSETYHVLLTKTEPWLKPLRLTAWQGHSFKALVKLMAKSQALKTAWQGHSFQALVKTIAKCQALKTAWQGHSLKALVKTIAKCQGLKTAWQGHSFQALVKTIAKCQALKTAWQGHSFQALVKTIAKCLWRLGRVKTIAKCQGLWRLLGRVTPSRLVKLIG